MVIQDFFEWWCQLRVNAIHCLSITCVLLLTLTFTSVHTQERCSEEGAVQLVGGTNVNEGRLEICAEAEWGTVCNDGFLGARYGFDINAARVVCRQLGVAENSLSDVVTNIFFGEGKAEQPIHLDNVHCSGMELSLLNCAHNGLGRSDCRHDEDVGIICKRYPNCSDGDVRLVDGDNYDVTAGRVEYCVGGRWGTVCNYRWGDDDAAVVCRQLGLNAQKPRALPEIIVPQIRNIQTPIVLDGLSCHGTETRLGNCTGFPFVELCTHSQDAGAFCTNARVCNNSDVRLNQVVKEQKENEGRIEFCTSGEWGLLCYDTWDNNDASVICRQLGFSVEDTNRSALATFINVGNAQPLTLLNQVNCVGTETNISQCTKNDSHQCDRLHLIAGVICPSFYEANCTDGDVRLQGGKLSNEIGRVEVCVSGQWGLVCDDDWDDRDASVVCRQLGYTGGVATHGSIFGMTVVAFYALNDVNCSGNETKIFDCHHLSSSECTAEAGVICGVIPSLNRRCAEETTNKTVSIVGSDGTNVSAGSIGTCQNHLNQSILCNGFYNSSDYIFTVMNLSFLSSQMDGRILPVLRGYSLECSDLISRVLCHYFFAPCGANGLLHLPLSVCSEECHYVESTCEKEWVVVNNVLGSAGLSTVNCSSTSIHLQGIAPCCIDARIQIKDTSPVTKIAATNTTVKLVTELSVTISLLVLCVIVVTVSLTIVCFQKRKAKIRSLQMEILRSPPTISPSALPETGVDYRSNVELYVLNVPKSSSDRQEMDLSQVQPTLTYNESKIVNSISCSLIRELSTSLLIPFSKLKLLECIGQGEFGVVYKAQYTEPGENVMSKMSLVAVKTLKGFFDNSHVKKVMEESIKMKHFDHPNVLHLMGVCLDAGPAPYVVMPYMANGSLLHYLKKERNNIVLQVSEDEDVKLDVRKRLTVMCLQIASGMEYLAGEKFVHRDLAARNCMIDIHFVIKIADFGLSEDIYAKNYFRQSKSEKSVKLPVKWMAPESLSDGVFSEKTDVWSFGVTCWEIFSGGKTPYPGMDPLLLSQMLDTGQRLNKPLNAACSDKMYSLMMRCWDKVPDERPSFSDIVTTIYKYNDVIAVYHDISFNPFKSTDNLADHGTKAADADQYFSKKLSKSKLGAELLEKQLDCDKMLIPYTMLKLKECVGQGEFGVVYKAQYTESEGDIWTTVAVKTFKGFFDKSRVKKIMEESIKMKHFDHPNVLHLIGVCLDAGPAPYVVMPYMANGSLLHYLKKERNNIVLQVGVDDDIELDVRKSLTVMCLQIASGMEYLAKNKCVHRILAARNCMIDIHLVIRIGDFGFSEYICEKNYFRQSGSDKSIKLPVKWMAPESLSDGVFSEKTDVWSFGVTCWEIFSGGRTPYPGMDTHLLSQMLDGGQRLNMPLNAACPDEMYSLMMNCWSQVPQKRPCFSEIVANISNYTEDIAGYLDVNFSPFGSTFNQGADAAPISCFADKTDDLTCSELPLNQLISYKHRLKGSQKVSLLEKPTASCSLLASPQTNQLKMYTHNIYGLDRNSY